MGKPPPGPGQAARKRDLVELRIANLQRELEAEREPANQAAILYQVGALYEHELEDSSEAFNHYGQAHAVAPAFQPAMLAQVRIAERSKNGRDLNALRVSQVENAHSPAVAAAALMDLGLESEDCVSLLRQSTERSPEPLVPALILEWLAGARGDAEAVGHALRTQAEHASDSSLASALWLDVALSELDAGRPDEAIDALEQATEAEAVIWPARSLQLRIAREHGRWEAFVRAATSMALILEAAADDELPSDALALSVPVEERLPMAALLWQEAAARSEAQLGDPQSAAKYIEAALRLLPDRKAVRLQALRILDRLGDGPKLRAAEDWFRTQAGDHPAFVAHELRSALSSDDQQKAIDVLREAASRYPESEYAQAALDVALIRGGARAERLQRLRERANGTEGDESALFLWHAAEIMASDPTTAADAQALYDGAIAADANLAPRIVREALGAAIRAKQPRALIDRCDELLQGEVDDAQSESLSFTRYQATQHSLGDGDGAQLLLRDAIRDPLQRAWAPHLARARAAWTGNDALLAEAHETLAELTTGGAALGHLSAAGQAYARARDWKAAERVLRRALGSAPEDRYVLSLLDGVLREGGRPEDVVSLARARSESQSKASLGEASLLLAGATAEQSGNPDAAQRAYQQALSENPGAPSAALALLDVARHRGDTQARLQAYAQLSDSGLGGGVAELFALLRGDALSAAGAKGSEAAAAYERGLEHPGTALAAAAALLTMPTSITSADQRAAAEEALQDAGETPDERDQGFAAVYAELRAALEQEDSFAGDAWLRLAALAPDESVRASATLQGLRETRVARGADAADELFILAQEAAGMAEAVPDAAIAIDESLAPGDDAEVRVQALERKLHHSESVGRGALEAARCRALVEAGRGADAVASLSAAVDERHDDLAVWETLRTAARQAQQWPLLAQACERLAVFVEGSLKADLLEEAGVVRLDCLEQYPQAEDLFRRALEEDPSRSVAFRRLHDLLAEQEDAEGLERLVSERLALDGPKDRLDLLYEQARLLRGFSDRPGALEVLGELFSAEPDHPGALALAAEVHVSLEHWAEAVDCLRRLSKSGIPEEQRRLAHLGAADFLEAHLDAKPEALAELRAIEALGLADAGIWTRIGAVELELQNRGAATDAYSRALDAEPTNALAISHLVELLEEAERKDAATVYERGIWQRIEDGQLDTSLLEGLNQAASWRGQQARASAAQALLEALGLAAKTEREATDLSQVSIAAVWDPNANPVLQELLRRAGTELTRPRLRSKKAAPGDPIVTELDGLSQRFGARAATIALSDELETTIAGLNRDREIDWVAARTASAGLDSRGRFVAGRLAWAAPHGAAQALDDSPEKLAGTLAAILRAARCELAPGGPPLPAARLKLRRATRKAIRDSVADASLDTSALLDFARSIQASADRAGLLASPNIAVALSVVLGGPLTLEGLKGSARALALARFWLDADSPLWRPHG